MNTISTPEKRSKSNKFLRVFGHIAALIAVSCWGSSFISTKILMTQGGFTPVEMYSYRFFAAYIVLLLISFKKLFANNWRDEVVLMICGMCSGTLYFITENYALQYTTVANVSLLSGLSPILTTLLMAAFFRQKVGAGVAIGTVVAAIGAGCVVFSHGEGFEFNPLGDILAFSSAFVWAIYTILVRNVMPHYNTFFITRKLFFYGVLTSIPFFLATQEPPYHFLMLFDFAHPELVLNFLFLVVMCSAVSYVLWNEAMKALGPVHANNYIYMQPIVSMIVAYITLGEEIYTLGYIGCVLIIGGLICADKLNLQGIRFIRK